MAILNIRDAIFFNGVLSNTAAIVFECRNALDATVIWIKANNSNVVDHTISLNIQPSDASGWTASIGNSVLWNEPIASGASIEKRIWIPLHDGDKVVMLTSDTESTVSAFLSGYQRRTT